MLAFASVFLRVDFRGSSLRFFLPFQLPFSQNTRFNRRLLPPDTDTGTDTSSMLIVHVHVRVNAEAVGDFIEATIENARNSIREPGIPRFDVVQQTALRNRAILNARDPEARRAYHDELRRIAGDPAKHRDYVMRTSMIQSLRDVEEVQ